MKAAVMYEAHKPLVIEDIEVKKPGPHEVLIRTAFAGLCHSDLHFARNEWHFTQYPAVPGHEIVGRVTAVGSGVKKRTKTAMKRTVRLSRTRSTKIVPRAELILRGLRFVMR